MNIALLQATLSFADVHRLIKEFPQFLFLSYPESSFQSISEEHWSLVEILLSTHLTPFELSLSQQLRWIHCPTNTLQRLCMEEIHSQGNILVSNTREDNLVQIGEFVMAGVLAYAKNLFKWKESNQLPPLVWDSKWRHTMWTLKDKIFLQIGLGKPGTEIARQASDFGMKVWGIDREEAFHPYCAKTMSFDSLYSALSKADIVSICLPRDKNYVKWFGEKELEAMKNDSILVCIGSSRLIDENALVEAVKKEKFRGVLLDGEYQIPISTLSPLWESPDVLVTPEVAPRPKASNSQTLKLFRYNLRQYVHGNYTDMKNLVDPLLTVSSGEELWY